MLDFSYFEPDLENRITSAKERAQNILNGKVESEDDFAFFLIMIIDKEKHLGIFSEYYKSRTLDELIFEAELTKGEVTTGAQRGQSLINNADESSKEELSDWLEKELSADFMDDASEFMKTGKFKE